MAGGAPTSPVATWGFGMAGPAVPVEHAVVIRTLARAFFVFMSVRRGTSPAHAYALELAVHERPLRHEQKHALLVTPGHLGVDVRVESKQHAFVLVLIRAAYSSDSG